MNDNEAMVLAVGIIGSTVSIITICHLIYRIKTEKYMRQHIKDCLDAGFEQKYDFERTQSSDYSWVKSK